ncbi:MAG: hypothetical protein WCF84_15695 [Anaerolineae bacterium]
MSNQQKEHVLELSKAMIGCLGAIGAACVGGVITLVTVFGPQLMPTRAKDPTPLVILIAPTAAPPFPVTETKSAPATVPPPSGAHTATTAPTPTNELRVLPTIARQAAGSFTSLQFAAGITADRKPVETNGQFPEGITQIYALYDYAGMSPGTAWRDEWYRDGVLQMNLAGSYHWDGDQAGTDWIRVTDANGLAAGQWEVRLYIGDRQAQKGTFVIERREAGAPSLGPIHFAEGEDNHQPVQIHQPDANFASGTQAVYAFCDAGNMPNGTALRIEWYRDGTYLPDPSTNATWQSDPNKSNFWVKLSNDAGLQSGTYELKMYIDGKLAQLGTFVIE